MTKPHRGEPHTWLAMLAVDQCSGLLASICKASRAASLADGNECSGPQDVPKASEQSTQNSIQVALPGSQASQLSTDGLFRGIPLTARSETNLADSILAIPRFRTQHTRSYPSTLQMIRRPVKRHTSSMLGTLWLDDPMKTQDSASVR